MHILILLFSFCVSENDSYIKITSNYFGFQYNYSISYDKEVPLKSTTTTTPGSLVTPALHFNYSLVGPQALSAPVPHDVQSKYYLLDVRRSTALEAATVEAVVKLEDMLKAREITVNGYKLRKAALVKTFVDASGSEGLAYHDASWEKQLSSNFFNSEVYNKKIANNAKANNLSTQLESVTHSVRPYSNISAENIDTNGLSNRKLLWFRTNSKFHLGGTNGYSENVHSGAIHLKRKLLKSFLNKTSNDESCGSLEHFAGSLPWEKISDEDFFNWDLISRKLAYELSEVDSLPNVDAVDFNFKSGSSVFEGMNNAYDVHESRGIERANGIIQFNRSPTRRKLLDMFADSLIYVNRLFNDELGLKLRKVPAHMPHFINITVMEELQER